MTRRDLIIISVLVNAGLLAVLFLTAVKTDNDLKEPQSAIETSKNAETSQAIALLDEEPEQEVLDGPQEVPTDEVDNVLKEYLPDAPLETMAKDSEVDSSPSEVEKPVQQDTPSAKETDMVEVTVKRGDALEKIARSNKTTVDAIKKANDLKNDRLKIGQVLKVPVNVAKTKEKIAVQTEQKPQATITGEPVWYTVKSGDNPWKIAKQNGVKFEDLLRLNNLDEERAKNLKIGDKVRVK